MNITKSQLKSIVTDRLTKLLEEKQATTKKTVTKSQLKSLVTERLTYLLQEAEKRIKDIEKRSFSPRAWGTVKENRERPLKIRIK
jgi:hypothetical protein